MRVFALPDFGTEPTLLDVPTPEPGPGEVLVRVHATSLNGFDLSVGASRLEGMMEHRFPVVLGKDFAGTVEAVGADADRFAPGDRVFGVVTKDFLGDGSFGEFVTVPTHVGIARLPDGVAFQVGGALGLVGITARQAIDALELTAGQTVLIAGATGGVGSLAVQLAAQAGARVIATAHGESEQQHVTGLGASEVVDYTEDLAAQVRAAYPGGVDAALHFAGDGSALLGVVRDGGRLASTLIMSSEGLPSKSVTVKAIYAVPTPEALAGLADAVASGHLTVPIQRTYAFVQVAEALRDFPMGTLGKLAITIQ